MIIPRKNTLFLLALSFCTMSTPSFAKSIDVGDGLQDCKQAQKIAQDVMFLRQNGGNVDELKKVLARGSVDFTRKEVERLADSLGMLDSAYNKPIEEGLARKHLASKDFSRAAYLQCRDKKVSSVIL